VADSVTVLIVDDETLIHPTLQDALEEGGFATTAASEPDQAIAMLEAEGASFSALVTDINLGSKLTGWDIAKRAREINPDIPVVYMTGFADNEWSANGVPNSVLLTKPFAGAQLVTAVSQLLNAATTKPG
jgi:DNA-binding NtrC family response regulator